MKFLIIALFTFILVGCTSTTKVSENLDNMSMTKMSHDMQVSSEKDFITMMIPHHQEAVDSSQSILDKVENPELKTFLEGVISQQSQEIQQLKTWYKDWYGTDYTDTKMYKPMMSDYSKIPAPQIEQTYIKEMIAHHLGAVQMANDVLNIVGIRMETTEFAQGVIDVQSTEISLLQSWVKE